MNLNIKLIFPSRSVDSSDNIQELNSYYDFKEQFDVQTLEHNLPFKDDNNKKALKSLRFNISHYLWAKKNVKLGSKAFLIEGRRVRIEIEIDVEIESA